MKHLLQLVIILFLFIGCNDSSRVDRQLDEAERLVEVAPDSAIALLDKILEGLSGKMNGKKARVNVLFAKARLKQGKSFLTIDDFDETLKYYEKTGDSVALPELYRLAANRMLWLGRRDSAVLYMNKAVDLCTDSAVPGKSYLYREISNLYATPCVEKDYNKAIEYLRLSLIEAKTPGERADALNDIGVCHSFENRNDSAVSYMDRALAEIDPTQEMYATIALNYANMPKADFRKSVAYLNAIRGESLGKLITLGFLYLNNAIPDSAQNYLLESRRMYNANPERYSINTYNNLRLLEQSIHFQKTGVAKPDSGTVTNDSISELSAIQKMISEERENYNNKLQLNLLRQKSHKRLLWIIGLSLVFFMLYAFGGYVWYSNRKYMALKQKLDKVKYDQIVSEAIDDVDAERTRSILIRRRLEICIEQFRSLRLQGDIDRMEIEFRKSGNYLPLKQRENVRERLVGCFADFIVDLKMAGAKLSMDDIVTCILSGLKASNAAIAGCLGVTDSAVRTRKSRLRSKLTEEMVALLEL